MRGQQGRGKPPSQPSPSGGRSNADAEGEKHPRLQTSRGRGTGFARPQAQRPPRGAATRAAAERGGHITLGFPKEPTSALPH